MRDVGAWVEKPMWRGGGGALGGGGEGGGGGEAAGRAGLAEGPFEGFFVVDAVDGEEVDVGEFEAGEGVFEIFGELGGIFGGGDFGLDGHFFAGGGGGGGAGWGV